VGTGRRRHWGLVGLIGLAFALRLFRLDFQSLWRDEVDAVRFACAPLADLLGAFVRPGQNGPLYHLLLRPWLHLAGDGEFGLRFFSLIWGVLAVPLTFRLARRIFPSLPGVACLAALLATTSPYLVWYSQEGKMYTLVVALILLSMDRYLAALERGGTWRWLVYVICTGLAPYVHFVAALIIPAQVFIFLAQDRLCRRHRWRPWLASLAVLTLPYLPLLAWQLPLLLHPGDTGFRFVPLPDMFSSALSSYSLGVVQPAPWWTLALFAGLWLAAGLLWRDRLVRPASLAVLLCWLLVPMLGLFLISLSRPLYTARYLIFVLPACLLLLAGGLAALGRRSRVVAGLWAVALLALNGRGLWLQATTPLKADFRAATRYVLSHLAADEVVLFQIPYGRYSFDYYARHLPPKAPGAGQPFSKHPAGSYRAFLPQVVRPGNELYRWAEGPYTNAGMSAAELDRRMAGIAAGSRAVWLVATEVALWDERGLVQAWLEQHGRLADQARFVQVSVYRYEFPMTNDQYRR